MFADRLNKTALADLGGISFKCSCGNRHSVSVKDVVLRDDALSLLPFFLKKTGKVFHVVFEKDVFEKIKDDVLKKIDKSYGFSFSVLDGKPFLTKEICDKAASEIPEEAQSLVFVGGSDAAEAGKYISAKRQSQWIFLCVRPDTDDMLSDRAFLWDNGVKSIFDGRSPDVLLCDVNLAFRLRKADDAKCFFIAVRNCLAVFDDFFREKVFGVKGCEKLREAMLKTLLPVKKLSFFEFDKKALTMLLSALIRVSLIKSLSKSKTEFLGGVNAVTNLLQGKTALDEKILAPTTTLALGEIYRLVLTEKSFLTLGKNCLIHAETLKNEFGIDCVCGEGWKDIDGNFEKERQNLLAYLEKCFDGIKATAEKTVSSEILLKSVKCATEVYSYGSMLDFLCQEGILDAGEI